MLFDCLSQNGYWRRRRPWASVCRVGTAAVWQLPQRVILFTFLYPFIRILADIGRIPFVPQVSAFARFSLSDVIYSRLVKKTLLRIFCRLCGGRCDGVLQLQFTPTHLGRCWHSKPSPREQWGLYALTLILWRDLCSLSLPWDPCCALDGQSSLSLLSSLNLLCFIEFYDGRCH